MKKYEIVKNNRDFNSIINNGKILKNKYYSVYFEDNYLDYAKFGIAVSKKIGNAVCRNKFKRQIRMIVNNNKKVFPIGKNYIIMVKRELCNVSFDVREKKLIELFMREDIK